MYILSLPEGHVLATTVSRTKALLPAALTTDDRDWDTSRQAVQEVFRLKEVVEALDVAAHLVGSFGVSLVKAEGVERARTILTRNRSK
jgi:hypothetical protein